MMYSKHDRGQEIVEDCHSRLGMKADVRKAVGQIQCRADGEDCGYHNVQTSMMQPSFCSYARGLNGNEIYRKQ